MEERYFLLTNRQKQAYDLRSAGLSFPRISEELGISHQATYALYDRAQSIMSGKYTPSKFMEKPKKLKKIKKPRKPRTKSVPKVVKLAKTYASTYDLSVLPPKQRKYFEMLASGKTVSEISEECGVTYVSVYSLFRTSIEKLDGKVPTLYQRNKKYNNKEASAAWVTRYREKNPEKYKEYMKKYYQDHREEILEKQKERRRLSENKQKADT